MCPKSKQLCSRQQCLGVPPFPILRVWVLFKIPSLNFFKSLKSGSFLLTFLTTSGYTAPTATNFRRWGVSAVDPACIMCGKPATLRYVLNGCPVALHQGRYTWRHNSVLSAIRHRLNTFWEQLSTQLAVQATVSTKEKARYIQFVRAGQRLPTPNHITQRKPLASQAILLQANDWTFLYDLEGQ